METTADRYKFVDETTNTSIAVTSNTTIHANKPAKQTEKPIKIIHKITGNKIEKTFIAEWATKIIRCDPPANNQGGLNERETVVWVREENVPKTTTRDIQEDNDRQSEEFSSTDTEEARQSDKNQEESEKTADDASQQIREKPKIKEVKTLPRELKVIIEDSERRHSDSNKKNERERKESHTRNRRQTNPTTKYADSAN